MSPFEALLTPRERQLLEGVSEAVPLWRDLSRIADQHHGTERATEALDSLYQTVAELSLQRARCSEAVGGLALVPRERMVLLERIAWADAGLATSICATWSQAAALEILAPKSLFEALVAPVLADETGRLGLAGAASEPEHGSEVHRVAYQSALNTKLRETPQGLVLDGCKWMMTNGGRASVYVVLAQRDANGARVRVVVPASAPGVSAAVLHKRGLRGSFHATLTLDHVAVPPEHVLPSPQLEESQRQRGVAFSIGSELLGIATIAIGVAQAAVDDARAYTLSRSQSGRLLAQHSTVALRLQEAQGLVQVARAAVWQGAELEHRRALSLGFAVETKAAAMHAARVACATATELVGAPALEEAHLLSKLSRDVDLLSVGLGTVDFWRAELTSLANPAAS